MSSRGVPYANSCKKVSLKELKGIKITGFFVYLGRKIFQTLLFLVSLFPLSAALASGSDLKKDMH